MESFTLGTTRVDLGCLAATTPRGTVSLTPTEGKLLERLLQQSGEPVDRSTLLSEVWGYHSKSRSRTIDTTLGRLRGKLEPDPAQPQHLITVRGKGVSLLDAQPVAGPPTRLGSGLIGRTALIDTLNGALRPGLITLTGALGSGKSAVAQAVAERSERIQLLVRLDEAEHPAQVFGTLLAGLQEERPPTPDATEEALIAHGIELLVLDGLRPGVLDKEGVERLATGRTVITTSLGRLGTASESVYEVPPLRRADAVTLLEAELARQGFAWMDDYEKLLDTSDRLPLEIMVLAPLIGLFGVAGGEALADGLNEPIRTSVGLLDAERRLLLAQLCIFESAFDVGDAAAITQTPRPALMAGLKLLVQRGLLMGDAGQFHVLRAVRTWIRSQEPHTLAERRATWVAHCASLQEIKLREGHARSQRLLPDLLAACHHCETTEQAVAIGLALFDVAHYRGALERVCQATGTLFDQFPDDTLRQLCGVLSALAGEPVAPEERAWLERSAEQGSMFGAALLHFTDRSDRRHQWFPLAVDGSASVFVEARCLPLLGSGLSRTRFLEKTARLRRAARTAGWTHLLKQTLVTELYCALRVDRDYTTVLRLGAEIRPSADILGCDQMMAMATARTLSGDSAGGRRDLEQALELGPGFRRLVYLMIALLDAIDGRNPTASLAETYGTPALLPGHRHVADALDALWRNQPVSVADPRVQHVLDTGRAPEGAESSAPLMLLAHFLDTRE